MSYFATVEKPDGEIETVNGVIEYKSDGICMYLAGVDFEMWFSLYHYKYISIQEGEL